MWLKMSEAVDKGESLLIYPYRSETTATDCEAILS